MRALYILAVAACLAATLGCNDPTAVYDRNRNAILRSHSHLVNGDKALARDAYDRAGDLYGKAGGALAQAITELSSAERDVGQQLRDLERQGAPQTGNVGGTRFYADTLRGYREILASAIVLRAVAIERQGEAAYRGGARDVLNGDANYRARQFATAHRQFGDADGQFGHAILSFTETLDYLKQAAAEANRLSRAAPPGTWSILEPLRQNVTYRLAQAGAYRSAAAQRTLQAAHVVSLYRRQNVGNIPEVDIVPLIPLPEVVRSGATPPPVPNVNLGK